MNNRGQTLIVFVIMIPIFVLVLAIVVDMGVVFSKKINLTEVSKTVIREVLNEDHQEEKVKEIFTLNNIDVDKLEVIHNENKLQIKNEIEVKSIFGNIIGKKSYLIRVDITGYQTNERIKFE